MTNRPEIAKDLDSHTFRNYYYLKEELAEFCQKWSLPTSGSKTELTERIAYYLDTGKVQTVSSGKKTAKNTGIISDDTIIGADFVCSETHRAYFIQKIGRNFSFNVAFQKWLKSHAGKTYSDAIDAYYPILAEKKKGKTKIDKQFEYNTYIRDFFANNPNKVLAQAIKCWKYKKSMSGHHRYEQRDLTALSQE